MLPVFASGLGTHLEKVIMLGSIISGVFTGDILYYLLLYDFYGTHYDFFMILDYFPVTLYDFSGMLDRFFMTLCDFPEMFNHFSLALYDFPGHLIVFSW